MTDDPADLAARIVEAAAIPIAEAADCGGGAGLRACALTPPGCQCRRVARAALAAAVRECGETPAIIRVIADAWEPGEPFGDWLRALAGIADG